MATKSKKKNAWKEMFYVIGYKLALEGLNNGEIASALEVTTATFNKWMKEKDGFNFAIVDGRQTFDKQKAGSHTLQDYIYGQLSPDQKRVWKELNQIKNEPNYVLRANRIFAKNGEEYRKYLFFHALTRTHFNPNQACRKLAISRKTLNQWIEEDLNFANTINQVEEIKDNFFEGQFVKLAEQGNPQVIMKAASTRLKHRGYGDSMEVKHTGSIDHNQIFDVSMLSEKLQQAILREMRDNGARKEEVPRIEGKKPA